MKKGINKSILFYVASVLFFIASLLALRVEMKKRYGFIYVDLDNTGNGTLERKRKDSFYYYKKLIESNGVCVFDE